jgi:CRP-like cAMP-binding protein
MSISKDLLITYGAEMISLKPNEYLFAENDAPLYYFQILTGKIKLANIKGNDGEFIQSFHHEGESVGEVFLFCKHHRYPASAVAMEECTVLRLGRSHFVQLLESDFQIQLGFLRNCAERTYYSYLFLNSLTSEDAAHQLLTVMTHLKENQNLSEKYAFKIPYTRRELASMTGLRIETVIRILKKLESEHVVKITRGRVYF